MTKVSDGKRPKVDTGNGTAVAGQKKIFFISSPHTDSDHDAHSASPSAPQAAAAVARKVRPEQSPSSRQAQPDEQRHQAGPSEKRTAVTAAAAAPADQGQGESVDDDSEFEDEEDESEDASSEWGSEYTTESDASTSSALARAREEEERQRNMFAKRIPPVQPAAGPAQSEARKQGLLSQLFHPSQALEEYAQLPPHLRNRSAVDLSTNTARPATAGRGLTSSKSAVALPVTSRTSFVSPGAAATAASGKPVRLGAKPEHVELEDPSSEEEEAGVEEEMSPEQARAFATALARHRDRQAQHVAPPQTPRTTRRNMLSSELSESLRRNLLWERSVRAKANGITTATTSQIGSGTSGGGNGEGGATNVWAGPGRWADVLRDQQRRLRQAQGQEERGKQSEDSSTGRVGDLAPSAGDDTKSPPSDSNVGSGSASQQGLSRRHTTDRVDRADRTGQPLQRPGLIQSGKGTTSRSKTVSSSKPKVEDYYSSGFHQACVFSFFFLGPRENEPCS
jgi:hypothetical protein